MKKYDKEALIELLKSFGRFVWFGACGLTIAWLSRTFLDGATDVTMTTIVVGFIIKAIDQYIHENAGIKSNGIALPFLQGEKE